MKKVIISSLAAVCLIFAAFTSTQSGPETKILGIWKYKSMIKPDGTESAFPFNAKMEILPDSVYFEYKEKLDGSGEMTRGLKGQWKLEANNTVLSLKSKTTWKPANIVKLTADSLMVEASSGSKLLFLKEK